MTREEFVNHYTRNLKKSDKVEFLKIQKAIICNCGETYCDGWMMVNKGKIYKYNT